MSSISAEINSYYSPQQLVQHFGGSTRAAAQAVGVSQRTVQRWIAPESAKQHRKPNKAAQAKIKAAMGRPKKINLNGKIKIGSGKKEEYREREIHFPGEHRQMSGEQWDRLYELASNGDDSTVWDQMAEDYGVSDMELLSGTIDIE